MIVFKQCFRFSVISNEFIVLELPLRIDNTDDLRVYLSSCCITPNGAAPMPTAFVIEFDRGINRVDGDKQLIRPVGYCDTESFIGLYDNTSFLSLRLSSNNLEIDNTHGADVLIEITMCANVR